MAALGKTKERDYLFPLLQLRSCFYLFKSFAEKSQSHAPLSTFACTRARAGVHIPTHTCI